MNGFQKVHGKHAPGEAMHAFQNLALFSFSVNFLTYPCILYFCTVSLQFSFVHLSVL